MSEDAFRKHYEQLTDNELAPSPRGQTGPSCRRSRRHLSRKFKDAFRNAGNSTMDSTTRLRRTRRVIGRLRRISEIAREEEYLWQVLVSDRDGSLCPRADSGPKLIRQLDAIHLPSPCRGLCASQSIFSSLMHVSWALNALSVRRDSVADPNASTVDFQGARRSNHWAGLGALNHARFTANPEITQKLLTTSLLTGV